MKLTIGNRTFIATLADTEAARTFSTRLPLTLEMTDYGGFEKIATIDRLATADKREDRLGAGDIMLYGGSTLVLFYADHGGYNYTRIGKIAHPEELKEALGTSRITVKWETDTH